MSHLARALTLLAVTSGVLACGRETPPASSSAPTRVRHVLLVTIDTLRADAVGAYGSAAARTPALDGLASRGTFFEQAYATAPITLTSHASMLTGLYPPGHGARHNGVAVRAGVPALAERFREAGVRTAAFVSAFPLDRSFGLARGFEVYSDRMPRAGDGRLANERPGRVAVDDAIAWLNERRTERVFAWVHLFEPHAPYGDPSDGRPARERYADEVADADAQVARLLQATSPIGRDTLVIVAGDHGEAFGEHGEVAHSIFVYDTTLRVPLILAGPGVPAGQKHATPVSLIDLPVTIARLADLRRWDTDGQDLLAPPGTRALYAESFAPLLDFGWSSLRSLRSGRWKYIAAPVPELFDLQGDPGEAHNVLDAHRAEAAALGERVARISGPDLPAPPQVANDDAKRRLQALGYVSGPAATGAGPRRDPKDQRELAAALALVTSGELTGDDLERTLVEILRRDPGNPQANLRLGYLRITQALNQDGQAHDARRPTLSVAARRRWVEAEGLLRRAVAGHVPGADAYLGIATCQGARGDVRGALESLERARAREPENPVVLANIGIALAKIGEPPRAIAALAGALAIDPDLHEARFNLALVHARAGERESARRQAEELLRRLPPAAPERPEVERLLRSLQ